MIELLEDLAICPVDQPFFRWIHRLSSERREELERLKSDDIADVRVDGTWWAAGVRVEEKA